MIYYCSGKVLVPVPVPELDLFSTVFPKLWTKSCLVNASAALFPRKLDSNFWFFAFVLQFYVGSTPKSDSGIGNWTHYGSGSVKAKSCGSFGPGSGSTTLRSSQLLVQWRAVLYAGVLEPVPLWGPVGRDPGVLVHWRAVLYLGVLEPVPLWRPVGRDPSVRGRQHQGAQAPPLHLLRLLPSKFLLEIYINIHAVHIF